MINKLSAYLTNVMINKKIIEPDEFELYHYGLFVTITEAWLMIFCILAGIIFNVILQSIVFFIMFFLVHRFAGGFHAKTEWQCQIITLSTFFLCIAGIKYETNINMIYMIVVYIVCCVVIIILSPADTPQKPLSKAEKMKFKKITAVIVLICSVIAALFLLNSKTVTFAYAIINGMMLQTVSVIFGRLLNQKVLSEKQ
ncbi:MAG: accessory gene regulator B family protein [Acetobacter sp.]|nr:accessory gene regulator B family protein [Bacteroides sp.]MCM1341016.1 accessory gene regulator B family protein [Acetobacter sp.]MCM1432428.1 accessory gene regulator B family protein [Clostridiales bacterium]